MGRFPALRGQLLEGEDVRTKDGLETPVDEESEIVLLPAMAGGATKRT